MPPKTNMQAYLFRIPAANPCEHLRVCFNITGNSVMFSVQCLVPAVCNNASGPLLSSRPTVPSSAPASPPIR